MNTSKRIMILVGIILIVGFVIMWIVDMSRKPALVFEPFDAQFALLDKVYANWFGEKVSVQSQPIGEQVICDWMNYKALSANQTDGWRDAADKFNANEMELVTRNQIQIDYWASVEAFEILYGFYREEPGMRESIIERCGKLEPDLDKYLDEDLVQFKAVAEREGFLDESGKLREDKRRHVELLHRHLWVNLASKQFPRHRLEPPEERLSIFKWQIEQSSLPDDVKLEKLMHSEVVERLSYDYAFSKAVLLYRNQKYWDACQVLMEALENTEDTFRTERYQKSIEEIKRADSNACDLR